MKTRFNEGDESMRPDCISYSLILNTYARMMMINNAEGLLWEMVDDFIVHGNTAAEPRTRKYIQVGERFAHITSNVHISSIWIFLKSSGNFNTILAMHSRSTLSSAPERAEKVFQRYRDLCSRNLLRNKPDKYSYSLLLKAW